MASPIIINKSWQHPVWNAVNPMGSAISTRGQQLELKVAYSQLDAPLTTTAWVSRTKALSKYSSLPLSLRAHLSAQLPVRTSRRCSVRIITLGPAALTAILMLASVLAAAWAKALTSDKPLIRSNEASPMTPESCCMRPKSSSKDSLRINRP